MSTEVTRYSKVEILMAPGSPDGIAMVISGDGDELIRMQCDSYVWVRDYGESNLPPVPAEVAELRDHPEAGGTEADTVDGA